MARDYHQARYVLKQGNVTTFSVKDFNSEYNLVGFYNNRSVFEYTDEKLNSEPKQQIEDDISKKEASESSIFSKQIIIKPISSSGRVVLINDKNVKVSVKKCIDVPKNILKMLGEKQHVQAANIDSTNKIDGEHNLSTKFIRTYQKNKDKTYQSTNIDKDKHENVNIDLIEASTIKDCEGTCVSEAETAGIRTVDITKLSEEGLINKSSYKIPLDQIKELLKGAASKNLIFLKHPIERRKTIDSAELQVLKADIVPTVDIEKVEDNLRPVYFKGYVRKKPTVDTGETTPKETFSVINLSANISDTTTNVGDDGKRDGELSTTSTNSVGNQMCREDGGGIKLKIKRVVNKQETNHTVTDMGKIKHFKEKSSNADKCSTTLIAEEAVFEMSPTPIHAKFNSDSRDNLINTFEKFKEVVTPGYENWTILPDNFIRIEPHAGTTFTPIVDTNKRRQKNKAARAHTLQRQLIKQETQKYIKALVNRNKKKKLRSRSPKLVANSCQTETVKLNDNSTQTDSFQPEQEAPLPTTYDAIHLEDYEQCQIVVSDVNFGNGPQIPTCGKSGARAVYNLGNNLDNFVGDVNIAPTELVDMGYLNGENVHSAMISAKLQEKQTFQEYLKICRVPDSAGNLPLHLEVMSNNLNEVRRQALMLNLWKVSIDTPNASNLTPLHLAVIHDSDESIVSFLLERGADLSCTDAEGNNAMHLAVFHNSLKLLRLLLQRANDTDFNLNDFNYEGFSPLLLATIEDKLEMVKTFLEFDANPNVKDQKSGRTPLFHAVENNNLKMVKLLLHSDADKKIKNFSGTSTHDAVFELEKISPEIKNLIIGKELFTVNNTTVDKRKKPTDKRKEPAEKTKEVCTKKLKTVKTFRKIKM